MNVNESKIPKRILYVTIFLAGNTLLYITCNMLGYISPTDDVGKYWMMSIIGTVVLMGILNYRDIFN